MTIEIMINAATYHGMASELEQEVGDLQQLCRFLWSVLDGQQRKMVAEEFADFIRQWNPQDLNPWSQ